MINLNSWGFSNQFIAEASLYEELVPARVIEQQRSQYKIVCEAGTHKASVSGKFIHEASENSDYPAVGDWVMISCNRDFAVIHKILKRTSCFKRKAAGRSNDTQVVAANIDSVFICMALNRDFNLRRLERYLSVAWDSGAVPVVVLTKADLCDSLEEKLTEVSAIAIGTSIIVCSNVLKDGYKEISGFIKPKKTIAFIGSSGVGKSTIINHLTGVDILKTKEIREDGKGKHTTTHRQLILLPNGGIVIDTPGMRELGIEAADFSNTFADIEGLASQCRFSNCTHTTEPGCAIIRAIENGSLNVDRFENYQKLQAEAVYSELNSRQIEEEKINKMFGSKSIMKKRLREIKDKNNRR